MHALCPRRPEKGVGSPGTGVTDGCESCRCWELNLSPWVGQLGVHRGLNKSGVIKTGQGEASIAIHSPTPCLRVFKNPVIKIKNIQCNIKKHNNTSPPKTMINKLLEFCIIQTASASLAFPSALDASVCPC